jgi:hypothetical protein
MIPEILKKFRDLWGKTENTFWPHDFFFENKKKTPRSQPPPAAEYNNSCR